MLRHRTPLNILLQHRKLKNYLVTTYYLKISCHGTELFLKTSLRHRTLNVTKLLLRHVTAQNT